MALTSIQRAACIAAAFIGFSLVASCGGGGEAPAATSAPASARAFKSKDPRQTPPASTALVAGPASLVAAPATPLAIGGTADGGYTVAWCAVCASAAPAPAEVLAQRFDQDGASAPPARLALPETTGTATYAGAGVLSDGSIVLAYTLALFDLSANQQGESLLTQRYHPSGVPIGGPVAVATYVQPIFSNPGGVQLGPVSLLTWSDGTYLVAWSVGIVSSRSQTGPVYETYAQRYDSASTPLGARGTLARIYEAWGSELLSLTALDDGGLLAQIRTSGPPEPTTVSFVPLGSVDRTVPIPAGSGAWSQPVPLALGGYLRLATDSTSNAQILDNNGAVVATPAIHPGTPYALADGSFVVVWVDTAATAGTPAVFVQRYDLLGSPMGVPTRAGPAATPQSLSVGGAPLDDAALALIFLVSDAAKGPLLYTQLLHEPDLSRQQLVRQCRAAARDLVGVQHRQFMSRCLRAGGSR